MPYVLLRTNILLVKSTVGEPLCLADTSVITVVCADFSLDIYTIIILFL